MRAINFYFSSLIWGRNNSTAHRDIAWYVEEHMDTFSNAHVTLLPIFY